MLYVVRYKSSKIIIETYSGEELAEILAVLKILKP